MREAQAKSQEAAEALRSVRMEVGEEAGATARQTDAEAEDAQLIQATVTTLRDDIGPQLLMVAEMVDADPTGVEVKGQMQSVVSKIHAMFGVLRDRTEQGEKNKEERYNLADDDSELPELTPADYAQWGYADGQHGASWAGWYGGYHQQAYHYQHGGGWDGDRGWGARGGGYGSPWMCGYRDGHGTDGEATPNEDTQPSKKGRVGDDGMEEQTFEQMQVPAHMQNVGEAAAASAGGQPNPGDRGAQDLLADQQAGAGGAAEAAAAAAAAAEQEARRMHELRIAEFVAAASEKGIDISDIDLAKITPEELQHEARNLLA